MIILLIIAALYVLGKYGPVVESMFGETGSKIFIWAVGIVVLLCLIIREIFQTHFGGGRTSSGGGYSIDELEEFDMMDED